MTESSGEKKKSPFVEHFKTFLIIILGYNSIGGLVNSAFDGAIVWVGFFADINEVYIDARQTFIEPLFRWISIDFAPIIGDYVVMIGISIRSFEHYITIRNMREDVLVNIPILQKLPSLFYSLTILIYLLIVLLSAPVLMAFLPSMLALAMLLEVKEHGYLKYGLRYKIDTFKRIYKPIIWFLIILFCNYLYKVWIFERYVNS